MKGYKSRQPGFRRSKKMKPKFQPMYHKMDSTRGGDLKGFAQWINTMGEEKGGNNDLRRTDSDNG
jgi:hypothetical protein